MTAWAEKTEIPLRRLLRWGGVPPAKFYEWRKRYGKANEHNRQVPRDHWLEAWEQKAIIEYHDKNPLNGYRRLAFMMLDEGIVAASPTTVYRVLRRAGRLDRWNNKPSRKGTGFVQPIRPHEHWHIDITYVNVCGTFYYLCQILDGYSRSIVHWDLRESMTEREVEIIMQRARERFPDVKPRIISDNGPQFIARDFRNFIRICGMTHVRTSPYYPQSNGKLERLNQTLKAETIRPNSPASLGDARRLIAKFVEHYNTRRLHSAIGYVTPADKLAGREAEIWALRDQRLEAARARRQQRRLNLPDTSPQSIAPQPQQSDSR
jgi:putative transposase